ncbi:MAG: ribonuclease R, partial [Acidovorax sp.]|nr:ribonuclease R [Acidovorax sp.]
LSQVNVVYGSLTTAIVVLLSLEIAATLLLLGAQVISEYERIDKPPEPAPANPLRAEGAAPDRKTLSD